MANRHTSRLAPAALIVAVLFVSLCAARCVATFAVPCHGESQSGPCATLASQNWLPAPDEALQLLALAAALFVLLAVWSSTAAIALPVLVCPTTHSVARAGPASRRYTSISPRAP